MRYDASVTKQTKRDKVAQIGSSYYGTHSIMSQLLSQWLLTRTCQENLHLFLENCIRPHQNTFAKEDVPDLNGLHV